MKTLDKTKETKRYCKELNKMIPCKTQEDADEFSRVLDDYLSKCEGSRLYWAFDLWKGCKEDLSIAKEKLMYSGELELYPATETLPHYGLLVGYKQKKKRK